MIAGKTVSEILAMKYWTRCRWYKTIPPEEREEAMQIVDIAGRAKLRALWTPERKAKRSEFLTSQNNPMKHPEVIAKISGENHHMKRLEDRAKMSVFKIEYWSDPKNKAKHSGKNNPNFGKTPSEKTRAKMSVSKIENWKDPEYRDKLRGENGSNWQGGKSFEPYGFEFNAELKRQIRARDNHTCQECRRTEEQLYRALDVHHIDYDKKNNSPENLIALCKSCHSQTNFSREDWVEYFGGLPR